MRFMGIIGIVTFIVIAYIFSKNRKAVNWNTVAWGLSLQLLFAFTILGSTTVSFASATVLLLLIHVYIAKLRFSPYLQSQGFTFVRNLPELIIISLTILSSIILGGLIGYFVGVEGNEARITPFINVLWAIVGLIWFLRKFIHNKNFQELPINSALVLFTLSLSFGASLILAEVTGEQRGTIAYNMEQLSIGVGNFLSIPTRAGAAMIFGALTEIKAPWYFLFFVQVLPTIIFFSAFISVLYYLGIVQTIIEEMAKFMRWTMKTSGAETLSCAGNIFVGQTEAPILIKPYIKDMTKSEIHAVMTGGFATIAGGVFAGFVAMGIDAGYLIGASIMSAPAALTLSKIFYPETEHSSTEGDTPMPKIKTTDNIIAAAAQGTSDGLLLALNVGAMLLAFIALVKVVDMGLGLITPDLSLNVIFGTVFQYLAMLLGVSLADAPAVGALLGNKIAINEFIAYEGLAELIKTGTLSPRSQAIATYALCGFANFSSIGIQIGGITPMAPERQSDIASLGFSAMWAGAFASWMTAAIAGILIG